jgi:YHS domain-containing protein
MLPQVARLPVRNEPLVGQEGAMIREMSNTAIDPVCGMAVKPDQAAGMSRVGGTAFYFCSTQCNKTFDAEPERYANHSVAARPSSCCSGTSGRSSCQ